MEKAFRHNCRSLLGVEIAPLTLSVWEETVQDSPGVQARCAVFLCSNKSQILNSHDLKSHKYYAFMTYYP